MTNHLFIVAVMTAVLLLLLAGCDPVSRHKFKTSLLDGYPSMPSADEYFAYYTEEHARLKAAEAEKTAEIEAQIKAQEGESKDDQEGSIHRPYGEKVCRDCHEQANNSGLIVAKKELCGLCHKNFIQGSVVHGPVAVNACLICHFPHSSEYPRLLKSSREELCRSCHTEKRRSVPFHTLVSSRGIACVDCHDPHFSNAKYLL